MLAHALLTPDEVRRMDAAAPGAGVPLARLMENAGAAVARAIRTRFRPCRVLVVCGPGLNGADGAVAARILAARGWPVAIARLAAPHPGLAAAAHAAFRGPVVPCTPAEVLRTDIVVDAAFGAGFAGEIPDTLRQMLRSAEKVVAVDVPSGLDAMTGQWAAGQRAGQGGTPVAMTVTFVRPRPGHILARPSGVCGELVCADIGMPDGATAAIAPGHFQNGPGLWTLPALRRDGHKYDRGHVTIVGGATMTGAARLAAAAARRAGAGLVTIAAPFGGADIFRTGDPGVIVDDRPLAALLADARKTVWVCGPGLAPAEALAALTELSRDTLLIVGDAAVFGLAHDHPGLIRRCAVLTPHAGEFARAFGSITNPMADAARVAATHGVLVLKGAVTIIASAGRIVLNADAPPVLATAGSGDVLSGVIAGLLAQGMAPPDAACAGVWLHGRAGALAMAAHGHSVIAEDLPAALGDAMGTAHE